jgi:endoglucanase
MYQRIHRGLPSPRLGIIMLMIASAPSACRGDSNRPATGAVLLGAPPPPVVVPAGGNLLGRSTFKDRRSLPWMPLFLEPATGEAGVMNGAYCVRIDHFGKNAWDVQLRHREMTVQKKHTYYVRYSAWASKPIKIRAKVGMSGAPYTEYWAEAPVVPVARTEFKDKFQMWAADDPSVEFAFHLNDPEAKPPVTVCFDELHLVDPEFTRPPEAMAKPLPAVRVNQAGYYPHGPKRATWVLGGNLAQKRSRQPVPFELVDRQGSVVHRGMTEPFGRDPTSGTEVERIDFSSYAGTGEAFRLRVRANQAGETVVESDPFPVRPAAFQRIGRDAIRYFYYTRSGIALEAPFVEDPVWARPAGHPTDAKVRCAPDAGCSRELDVSGGWYDAGDYGKYVVNGGFTVWLLLNLWQVSHELGLPVSGTKDRDLNLPESGNGKPDLLDEVKWELSWLLRMQVPSPDPDAGLVHHKMHDADWTALGTPPMLVASNPRYLRPVSTAATLNLAAVGAQAARIYSQVDPEFATRCLAAAKRAWAAAEAHPALYITAADHRGGGAYEDSDTSDERFWAAVELYLATGEPAFFTALSQSPHYLRQRPRGADGLPQAMDWRTTDVLGTLSLALDASRISAQVRESNKRAIVGIAEQYLALSDADAFGQPYSGTHYNWGSNSFILNNGIILAYAHAFTKDPRFLRGAVAALDYVLGRNALAKSYVSGYGARPLTNPHHRLWARSIDPKFPPPPPGVVSGGPNSDLQDPYSKAGNLGCIGQTCYFDHIEAYSANEVAINWNAALAWLVAYVNAVL